VLRVRLVIVLLAVTAGATVLAGRAHAQTVDAAGQVGEITLPGGLGAALAVIGDRAQPDRSQFLFDIIRRVDTPVVGHRDASLGRLLAHLENASGKPSSSGESLPLPLPTQLWIDAVFEGRATPATLVTEILRSRNASLFYCGLVSLDDRTRAWLAGEPALVRELAGRNAAAFLVAAPALRVGDGMVVVPGGAAAAPAWEALVQRQRNQPVDFIRELVGAENGRLAYFFGALAQLTAGQAAFALNLEAPDPAVRTAALRRLYGVFERIAGQWQVDDRPFWRPVLDPALLLGDLEVDAQDRPIVPGTRAFWNSALSDSDDDEAEASLAQGEPVDFGWLCEQVFRGNHVVNRNGYDAVLFASRVLRQVSPETGRDAVVAVRAARIRPLLIAALERAGVHQVGALANAARRAAQVSRIDDHARASRALAQFQGALALVSRAASRGAVPVGELPALVSSLASVQTDERGEYDGRMVRWVAAFVESHRDPALNGDSQALAGHVEAWAGMYRDAVGSLDHDTIDLMAASATRPSVLDWEGTRYRVDFKAAEATRLARLLGDDARPYLSSARALVTIADVLAAAGVTRDRVDTQAALLAQVIQAGQWEDDILKRLQRVAGQVGREESARGAVTLRGVADELLARGLLTLAYAAALGQPGRSMISASDAASRHDFGVRLSGTGRTGAWSLPTAGVDGRHDWRVTGSILGLDVTLAEFALLRLSNRPPPKPSLNDEDRHAFIESIAIIEPAALTDGDRDVLLTGLRAGRARLAGVRTAQEAGVLANDVRLPPIRRSLLTWVVAHEPDRLASFLSTGEVLWLGLGKRAAGPGLNAWGAPGRLRLGCLCLRLDNRQSWDSFAGRWGSGLFVSGFPDLNLRLAELLSELRMPAPLLGPVLASATLDFVNAVVSRDRDDRRGLIEFVQALNATRVEQYLALLTTDGPLVPVEEGSTSSSQRGVGMTTGERR
jgi:hypothetical protein